MKTILILLLFTEMIMGSSPANAQLWSKNLNESVLLKTKYKKNRVWDAKRSPTYPKEGELWKLTEFRASMDAGTKSTINWGIANDRYLMFCIETDNSGAPIEDDINHTKAMYTVSLKLYEHTGKLVKTVSHWGALFGSGAEGFMYEQEGCYGTFFAAKALMEVSSVSYRPNQSRIDRFSQLLKISTKNINKH